MTQSNSEKTIAPSKLMIQPDHTYGIMLNPSEQCYGTYNDEQFISSYALFVLRLKPLLNILLDFELYPEYSPAKFTDKKSMSPRLHFHGSTKVDVFNYYTYGCNKIQQYNKLGFQENPDLEYCKKNENIMKTIFCGRYRVPYKITPEIFRKKKLMQKLEDWAKRAKTDSYEDQFLGNQY